MVSDIWPVLLPLDAMGWSVVSEMWPMLPPLGTMFGMWFLICGLCRYLLVKWFGNDV